MPAYCLLDNLEITDSERLERYKARVAPVVQKFGGQYRVLGGKTELAEGTWKPTFPVMIEFPNFERARSWYYSEEYRDLKALRLAAGRFNAVIIEGLEAPPDFVTAAEQRATMEGDAP
jgi:uncharacterized protein (DUF1330 family)